MTVKILRKIRIEGDIAYVPLTRGYEAIIDAADVPVVREFNWKADVNNNTVYACTADFSSGKRRNISMHRLLMGFPDGRSVDHEDRNGLNNRRSNLRNAKHAENARNCKKYVNNTSGFKGVRRIKAKKKKWRADIKVNGRSIYLGYYHTPEEAYAAYCEYSALMHGEFGRVS